MENNIPLQQNSIDCGVFVLTYSKYLAANRKFSFSQEDMPTIRILIKQEIENQKIFDIPPESDNCTQNIPTINVVSVKTELSKVSKVTESPYIVPKKTDNFDQREVVPPKFNNPCATICWLNSLLQLFCLMFDKETLTSYQIQSKFVKYIRDFKEFVGNNSAQSFRLMLTEFDRTLRTNQQDPMEFFARVSDHPSSDLVPFLEPLKVVKQSWTFCIRDNNHYSEGAMETHFYIAVDKPARANGLKDVIEKKFQAGVTIEDWKCPVTGCGRGGVKKKPIE